MTSAPFPGARLAWLVIAAGFVLGPAFAAENPPTRDLGKGEDAVLLEETLEIDVASPTSARVPLQSHPGADAARRGALRLRRRLVRPGRQRPQSRGRRDLARRQADRGQEADDRRPRRLSLVRALCGPRWSGPSASRRRRPGSIVEYSWEQEVSNFSSSCRTSSTPGGDSGARQDASSSAPGGLPRSSGRAGSSSWPHDRGEGRRRRPDVCRATCRRCAPKTTCRPSPTSCHTSSSGRRRSPGAIGVSTSAPGRASAGSSTTLPVTAPSRVPRSWRGEEPTASLTDPDAKIRAVYEFVQSKINYVAISARHRRLATARQRRRAQAPLRRLQGQGDSDDRDAARARHHRARSQSPATTGCPTWTAPD